MAQAFKIGDIHAYAAVGYPSVRLESSDTGILSVNDNQITAVGRGMARINVYDTSTSPETLIDTFSVAVMQNEDQVGARFGIGEKKSLRAIRKLLRMINGVVIAPTTTAAPGTYTPPDSQISISGSPSWSSGTGKWEYSIEVSAPEGIDYTFLSGDMIELVNADNGNIVSARRMVTSSEIAAKRATLIVRLSPGQSISTQGHVVRNGANADMEMSNVIAVPASGVAPAIPTTTTTAAPSTTAPSTTAAPTTATTAALTTTTTTGVTYPGNLSVSISSGSLVFSWSGLDNTAPAGEGQNPDTGMYGPLTMQGWHITKTGDAGPAWTESLVRISNTNNSGSHSISTSSAPLNDGYHTFTIRPYTITYPSWDFGHTNPEIHYGDIQASAQYTKGTPVLPGEIANLVVTSQGNLSPAITGVTLNWTVAPNAASYQCSSDGGSTWTVLAPWVQGQPSSGNESKYVTPDQLVTLLVRGVNGWGYGASLSVTFQSAPFVPAPAKSLTSVVLDDLDAAVYSLKADWALDSSSGIDYIRLATYRSDGSGGWTQENLVPISMSTGAHSKMFRDLTLTGEEGVRKVRLVTYRSGVATEGPELQVTLNSANPPTHLNAILSSNLVTGPTSLQIKIGQQLDIEDIVDVRVVDSIGNPVPGFSSYINTIGTDINYYANTTTLNIPNGLSTGTYTVNARIRGYDEDAWTAVGTYSHTAPEPSTVNSVSASYPGYGMYVDVSWTTSDSTQRDYIVQLIGAYDSPENPSIFYNQAHPGSGTSHNAYGVIPTGGNYSEMKARVSGDDGATWTTSSDIFYYQGF